MEEPQTTVQRLMNIAADFLEPDIRESDRDELQQKFSNILRGKLSISEATCWRPISEAPAEVTEVARYVRRVGVGEFVGRCYMLRDRSWVVFKFSDPGGELGTYFILPEPPR